MSVEKPCNLYKKGECGMTNFDPQEYWEGRLTESWGLHGVGYLGLGKNLNNWLYRVRKRIFFRYIKPLLQTQEHTDVLDIGSGTGFYVRLWGQLGVDSVTATDITEVAIEKLGKEFPGVKCHLLNIGEPLTEELKDQQFHLVSAFDILFHIVDDKKYYIAIENIYQLLQPGGFFVFSDNFIHGDSIVGQNQVSRSIDEIEKIVKQTGFKIMLRKPVFVLMNAPVDTKNSFLKSLWNFTMAPLRRFPFLGTIVGLILYPIELMLLSFIKEGPSTEIMICKKE